MKSDVLACADVDKDYSFKHI